VGGVGRSKVVVPPPEVIEVAGARLAALVQREVRYAVEGHALMEQRDALLPRLVSGEFGVLDR